MIAFLSDVHGNLEALERVLKEIEKEKVQEIIFLGDAVGYGANPNETVSLLKDSTEVALLGNHDAAVIELENLENYNEYARVSLLWTKRVLKEDAKDWLKRLPFMTLYRDEIRLVHSAPRSPRSWKYLFSLYDIWHQFSHFEERICFFGHTHIQAAYALEEDHIRELNEDKVRFEPGYRYMINPGSVGQPRDGDPRAAFGLLDPEASIFLFKRVEYDIEKAQRKIIDAGLPAFLAERLSEGI